MAEKPLLTPQGFDVLERWIKAEAKLAMAERTYQNDRAIGEVAAKTAKARRAAYALFVVGAPDGTV